MIAIFTGTYGAGKTHFMVNLSRRFGFKIIPTYTTRELRINEIEKIQITKPDFTEMMCNNLFIYVKEHFGENYGILKADMDFAESDTNIWMIDFPIDKVF